MFHPYLQRQLKQHLGEDFALDEKYKRLLTAISKSYTKFEKEKNNKEHFFAIHENEYQTINKKLQELTQVLENRVKERTKELEEVAQFPMENPNPIFRVSLGGEILFRNPVAKKINTIEFNGKKFSISDFFYKNIKNIIRSNSFDLVFQKKHYIFYFKKIKNKEYFNFYGTDVTEKNKLKSQAQESFNRLSSFLESTEDAYYILYKKNSKNNYLTSKWKTFFGFGLNDCKDILEERKKYLFPESVLAYNKLIKHLKVEESATFLYRTKNKKTGKTFWLQESITKRVDAETKDIVISGRITDVTQQQLIDQELQESEQRFRTLVDAMPVMIWVSNEHNKVTYSNTAFKKFLGFSLESLKDYKEYVKFVHPDDRIKAVIDWKKNIDKKKSIIAEYRLRNINGKYYNVLEQAVPRFFSDGKFAGYIGAYFDLTKEKSFQQFLSLEKEKLELLTRNSPDIIILMDQHKKIEYVSPTAERILGYSEKEMLGKKFERFICEECNNYLEKNYWLKMSTQANNHFEYRMKKKNGDLIWVESAVTQINQPLNGAQKYLMHNRDIHSIKAAEDALKEREQKYRGLFENMNLGVMEVDLEDRIQWVNKSFEKMTGYSFSYLKGKNAFKTFLSNTIAKIKMDDIKEKRREKKDSIYEVKMKVKDGETKDVVISGSPIIDLNGKVKGSVGIHWDVTNIKKMERMIEEEKLSRQKDIMKATLNAEEQQRLVIGNELHDGVGHTLTYTSLFLQMAANAKTLTPEIIVKAKGKVDEALKEIKRISTNLVPPALIDLGFKEAIVELFNQYSKVNRISFKITCKDTDFANVNLNAQRNIYRIVQELLNNTVKHSKASAVSLNIKKTRQSMALVFFNNGNAFDPSKVKRGLGLNSIHNRTYFYNGDIHIESLKNKGTRFNISIPLKNIVNHG